MEPKIERQKIGDYEAIIMNDGLYTVICSAGEGGPVVSDKDPFKAVDKFHEAMALAQSVKKLMYFKEHGKFPE